MGVGSDSCRHTTTTAATTTTTTTTATTVQALGYCKNDDGAIFIGQNYAASISVQRLKSSNPMSWPMETEPLEQ